MSNNSVKFWNDTWKKQNDRYYNHFDVIIGLLPDDGSVIDVGCGVGTLLKLIKKRRPLLKIEGRDHSKVAIEKLKRFKIGGLVEKLPNISGKADVVIATEVLEHIKDDEQLLRNMSMVAKKIIITVPNDRLGPEECDEHERKYTADSLGDKLNKYFKHYDIYDVNGYLLAVAYN